MRENKEYERLAAQLVYEYNQKRNGSLLANLNKRNYAGLDVSKEKILEMMKEQLKFYMHEDGSDLTDEEEAYVLELVACEIWGYGIIQELILNGNISDIKIYGDGHIRIKKKGRRFDTDIRFESVEAYKAFVTRLLERNKVNLGTANAIQTFTDLSQENCILRITIVSGLLTDGGMPVVAIRKIPKDKYTIKTLVNLGMFRRPSASRWEERTPSGNTFSDMFYEMIDSRGILFTGKGASGKTTLMNACIAEIPHDESVMICQENAELFDYVHPDLFACHVINNSGDSKISYELGDLTRAALLVDIDRVIVGEVKDGAEAAGLSKASMTGHKCWTSVHGDSCEMAVDKMADYISQATGYSTKEALKQLLGFEYVVHLNHFQVDEIMKIVGWDKEKECLRLVPIFPFKGGVNV